MNVKISEDNLVVELKKRNPKALDYVVDNYGGLIKAIVKKTLYKFEGSGCVEECMNDVFLAVWDNIDKFYKENSFKSWVAAIAKYKSIDYQRKLIKELHNEDIDALALKDESALDSEILAKENREEMINLLSNLKQEDKEIFMRRYFQEQSTEDIGKHMGINREAVNNRLSRGRKKLKSIILGEEVK
jgi:RNA polymerase sigma-70 factor (ECF subfamily)